MFAMHESINSSGRSIPTHPAIYLTNTILKKTWVLLVNWKSAATKKNMKIGMIWGIYDEFQWVRVMAEGTYPPSRVE